MTSRWSMLLLGWLTLLASCAWISEDDRRARYDVDGDGVERPADCDDDDPAVSAVGTWYADLDGDGFGDDASATRACQPPPGAVPVGGDCDDADPAARPGAEETCNGVDDDCDGDVDQGLGSRPMYADADADGFGAGPVVWICGDDHGHAAIDGDCDDDDDAVHPDAEEICNGVDDDCDGDVDLDDPSLDPLDATWFTDRDADGFGDETTAVVTCEPLPDHVAVDGDCDDDDPDRSPGLLELCNGDDDDCDGVIDEDDAVDAGTWYLDGDSDGYGRPLTDLSACLRPVGYVGNALDCDDAESLRRPGAAERCDGVDNDCDALVDDDDLWVVDPKTWYADADGDGFGTSGKQVVQCAAPAGYAPNGNDCRDDDAAIHPAALEVCDEVDNDCDLATDDDDDDLDLLSTPAWYADLDADGYGDEDALVAIACVGPAGAVTDASDCDDTHRKTHPHARELCDARDNDCDGEVDEDTPTVWYADLDGDGFGDPSAALPDCNQPPGYVLDDSDCDDALASVHPGAPEVCDGVDSDCDGLDDDADPDSDAATWYADLDGDGFGDPWVTARGCERPPSFVADDADCDDADAAVSPAGVEVCDGVDNDCDGFVDDADPEGANPPTWYLDGDLDGQGDPATAVSVCEAPYQHVATAGDCDDADPAVFTGAPEVCGGVDDDCDGLVDDEDPDLDLTGATVWHADADADGFGDPLLATAPLCAAPEGHVADGTDCDDAHPGTWPGAAERCDLQDNDCDGIVDEDTPTLWYADGDGDGFGDGAAFVADCDPVPGHVLFAGDCDDANAAVQPGAPERCNAVDDDCDGLVDDDDPDLAEPLWYIDEDGDGFGDDFEVMAACAEPAGYVADATDCDDGLATVHPGAAEVCNLRDDDCDGLADDADPDVIGVATWYADLDDDGYGDPLAPTEACAEPPRSVLDATDCDDGDYKVHPGAAEVCDSVDNDCDDLADDADPDVVGQPTWYDDLDDDGHGDPATASLQCAPRPGQVAAATDCDDADPTVYTGAIEECDGVDDDCDGAIDDAVTFRTWYADLDLDGYGDPADAVSDCVPVAGRVLVGSDCDDGDPAVHPTGAEVCNGVDDDCDGLVDDDDPTLDRSGQVTWYDDADLDGYGDDATAVVSCDAPPGAVDQGGDCDDANPDAHPGAEEVAGNEIDEDCSGDLLCFVDLDGDGFGDGSGATVLSADLACATADGEALVLGDCDDSEPLVHEGNVEVPGNHLDEDCSGDLLCFVDLDGDGFGDRSGATVVEAGDGLCDAADGEATNADDCDDGAATTNPLATEVAGNEVDEDCTDDLLCFVDLDGDGFGDDSGATVLSDDLVCDPLDGEAVVLGDCDDLEPLAHPGRVEVCNDGVDNDCDGLAPGCRVEGTLALADLDHALTRELAGDLAGSSLAAVGDVTGDGSADLLVGGPLDGGAAWLLSGPVAGQVALSGATKLTGLPGDALGAAVTGAGDLDGDGALDLAVGAPLHDGAGTDRGAVLLHHGPVATTPDVELYGAFDDERFGEAVAGPANLDDDPFADLVIGAPSADHFANNTGAVYLMSGATLATGDAELTALAIWTGTVAAEEAGACVATGDDLDGDGRDDVITGSPGAGIDLFVFEQGVVDVILDPLSGTMNLGSADAHYKGLATGDRVGEACAMAGDVNGDGFGDFLIGAPSDFGGDGRAWLVLGPPPAGNVTQPVSAAAATLFSGVGAEVGAALAGLGDVDGDGLDDVAVGAPGENGGVGAAYLLYGAFSGTIDLGGADLVLDGASAGQRAGSALAGGDLDGDGKSDLVVGAVGEAGQLEAGYVLFGEGL